MTGTGCSALQRGLGLHEGQDLLSFNPARQQHLAMESPAQNHHPPISVLAAQAEVIVRALPAGPGVLPVGAKVAPLQKAA